MDAKLFVSDGDFKAAPELHPTDENLPTQKFNQIYSIHDPVQGTLGSEFMPLVSAILPDKKKTTYAFVFDKILQACHKIRPGYNGPVRWMLDYEEGTMWAIRRAFPGTIVSGCCFHWGKCLHEHLQNVGLQSKRKI